MGLGVWDGHAAIPTMPKIKLVELEDSFWKVWDGSFQQSVVWFLWYGFCGWFCRPRGIVSHGFPRHQNRTHVCWRGSAASREKPV